MTEEKCKVCDQSYSVTEIFCPHCGFERHVLAMPISQEVENYERRRVEEYSNKWRQAQEQKTKIDSLNSDLEDAKNQSADDSQKIKELNGEITELNGEIRKLNGEIGNLNRDLKEATRQTNDTLAEKDKQLAKLQQECNTIKADYEGEVANNKELKQKVTRLESATKVVEAQRKDLADKLNKANDSLAKEVSEHKKTKKRLEQLESAATPPPSPVVAPKPKPTSKPQPPQVPTQQRGEPVAKVIFSYGSNTVEENIYEGTNDYAIPSSMSSSVSGYAFRIEVTKDKTFRLYDLCGLTCKVNGDKIGPRGMQLHQNDYFGVGDITIQVKLPKMNWSDFL